MHLDFAFCFVMANRDKDGLEKSKLQGQGYWHVLGSSVVERRYGKYYKLCKTNFPFYKTITNFLCYKINFPFYKTKLQIMILTFHIFKLSGFHNINVYILILTH